MSKITFNKLNLKVKRDIKTIDFNDSIKLEIQQYLPQAEKAAFMKFVLDNAMDAVTGSFSPIRTETWFAIAIAKFYAGITFTDKQLGEVDKVYDALETNGVISLICANIPQEELKYISKTLTETAADIARFNSSAAGIISAMNNGAGDLNEQLSTILEKIKNKEGIEELSAIREIMGKND